MASVLAMAKEFTMREVEVLLKDASYIPEENLGYCAAGCAKTAAQILREIAGSNQAIAAAIKGEEPGEAAEKLAKRIEEASSLDALSQLVRESANAVCDAIDSHSEADLGNLIRMPWEAMFPLGQAIFLPVSHMTYHDGQINYIQLLLGDSKFHWAGE